MCANIKKCEKCGSEFASTANAHRFCSLECRGKYKHIPTPKRWQKCKLCGDEFHGHKRKFCTKTCRQRSRNRNTLPDVKACANCGREFKPNGSRHIFCEPCGKERSRELDRKNRKQRGVAGVCRECGGTFVRHKDARWFCSRECTLRRLASERAAIAISRAIADGYLWWVNRWRRCVNCDGMFLSSSGRLYCSKSCGVQAIAKRDRLKRLSRAPMRVECNICGNEFERIPGYMWICSDECRKRKQRAMDRRHEAKRIMRKHNNRIAHAEIIDAESVYCSSLWICGICGETVDHWRTCPDLLSAELDHVVPLSKGGTHTRANVQCTHRLCNAIKTSGTQEEAKRAIEFIKFICGGQAMRGIAAGQQAWMDAHPSARRRGKMGKKPLPLQTSIG